MLVDDMEQWFAHNREVLETAYLAGVEPWEQSGQSGPFERWMALRKPIADCINGDGTLLDIGCANGYLLECCLAWTAERGIQIEPFGVDLSAQLISLAQERLPAYRDHFWAANAFTWKPPRHFTFVRTELYYAPAEHERSYILHLLTHYLEPNGRLLIANYGEGSPHPEHGLLPGQHPTRFLLDHLQTLGISVSHYEDGFDPIKGRMVRVAVVIPPFVQ
jgi:hypothetical protein